MSVHLPHRAWLPLLAAAFILSSATHVLADDLSATLVASKISLDAEGKEARTSAEEANPGDLIEYVATYRNDSGKAMMNLKPLLPIPAGAAYESETARPTTVEGSVDGEKFEAVPLKRLVKQEDGSTRETLVPVVEYRALRWTIGDLQPGAETKVSARVRLLTSTPEQTTNP